MFNNRPPPPYAPSVPPSALTTPRWRRALSAIVAISAITASYGALAKTSYHKADKPILDGQGRTRIIIDFVDYAFEAYPQELLAAFDPKKDSMQPQVNALIASYEARLGFKRELVTTWVGSSVTAFLTTTQIELLSVDPQVKLLTEDAYEQFSAPLWYPAWNGAAWGELNDWGRVAVGGKTIADVPAQSARTVYIIDGGVANHDDLNSVVGRVNTACGGSADCSNVGAGWANQPGYYAKVACNAHATHVAGIVGATANNGKNRAGVFAGVPMVSVAQLLSPSADRDTGVWVPCGRGGPTISAVGAAFDYIYAQLRPYTPITHSTHIATMSINSGRVGFNAADGTAETNRGKLLQMVNPAPVWIYFEGNWVQADYNGVFFVQSAGNNNTNACSLTARGSTPATYTSAGFLTSANATSTAVDGIMVVGAIKDDGDAVAGTFSGSQPADFFLTPEPGSNYGPCVDIWAPGEMIYSLWGHGPGGAFPYAETTSTWGNQLYTGSQPNNYIYNSPYVNPNANPPYDYYGWAWGSGTSFAAPHVAAAAAYVASKYSLNSPIAIEAKLRELWQDYGKTDAASQSIKVVHLGP